MTDSLQHRMRDEWNRRAREDAKYYVAFGRREQGDAEFFDSAAEMVRGFRSELRRLPAATRQRARRALEIGCGPGRLMRPLSGCFGEILGIDVSDEMVTLARKNLGDIPHARPLHAPYSDLRAFADESFDFVYSYAVFQHIPDREVVFGYFREAARVLKEDGIARFQLNGLPEAAAPYDTWSGVRIRASEVSAFAREHDLQLLALEGVDTQYMWTTWRKRMPDWAGRGVTEGAAAARLFRITNTFSSEPVAPTRGRFASVSLWMENLPPDCDLNTLDVLIGGERALPTYIGPPENDGLRQINACLPSGLATGLQPVTMVWNGAVLGKPASLRVIPPGPAVPRIVTVTDGTDLLSKNKIVSGTVKVVVEEIETPRRLSFRIDGDPVPAADIFCTDPRVPQYEVNLKLPSAMAGGTVRLEIGLDRRRFAPIQLEIDGS